VWKKKRRKRKKNKKRYIYKIIVSILNLLQKIKRRKFTYKQKQKKNINELISLFIFFTQVYMYVFTIRIECQKTSSVKWRGPCFINLNIYYKTKTSFQCNPIQFKSNIYFPLLQYFFTCFTYKYTPLLIFSHWKPKIKTTQIK